MTPFRRSPRPERDSPAAPPTEAEAISDFWTWWSSGGADTIAAAIAGRRSEVMVEAINEHLGPVTDGLAWELSAGDTSQHRLVVTAAGDPLLRASARRWLRAAPQPDDVWEYGDTRPPAHDLADIELAFEGRPTVALDEAVVAVERRGHLLDVVVHHAAFAALTEDDARQVTFLALDAALGETDVETWIGAVEPATSGPTDVIALRELRDVVAQLKADSVDEDGEPTWVLLRGDGPEGPVVALAQVPLASASAPQLDQHLAVHVTYADQTDAGFPGPGSLDALRDLEDHLVGRLGGSGRLVAHESSAGVRVLHFYIDSTAPGVAVVRAAVTGWEQGAVEVIDEHDPGWSAVRHLRT